jgi:hypothetical protein
MDPAVPRPPRPAIPRRLGAILVGLIWSGVGLMLLSRALSWEAQQPSTTAVVLGLLALLVAIPAWFLGFSHIAHTSAGRLAALPARIGLFSIQSTRGWLMVAVMIPLGIALRHSAIPRAYLIPPYAVMGALLLAGSFGFFRLARRMESD